MNGPHITLSYAQVQSLYTLFSFAYDTLVFFLASYIVSHLNVKDWVLGLFSIGSTYLRCRLFGGGGAAAVPHYGAIYGSDMLSDVLSAAFPAVFGAGPCDKRLWPSEEGNGLCVAHLADACYWGTIGTNVGGTAQALRLMRACGPEFGGFGPAEAAAHAARCHGKGEGEMPLRAALACARAMRRVVEEGVGERSCADGGALLVKCLGRFGVAHEVKAALDGET